MLWLEKLLGSGVECSEMDGERSGRQDVCIVRWSCSDIEENGAAQFQNFRISINLTHSSLYKIIRTRVGYQWFCVNWLRICFRVLTKRFEFFLERYHIDDIEFLNHIVGVRGDESYISVPECWTLRVFKALEEHTFTKQAKKFKQTLFACQKTLGICFLGQERSADDGIHSARDQSDVTNVLWNTQKEVCRAIKNERRRMMTWCNAPPWRCASACGCSHSSTAGAFHPGVVWLHLNKFMTLVRKRTIPTERPPLLGEVSANVCK
jgi:hypothetical protein